MKIELVISVVHAMYLVIWHTQNHTQQVGIQPINSREKFVENFIQERDNGEISWNSHLENCEFRKTTPFHQLCHFANYEMTSFRICETLKWRNNKISFGDKKKSYL